MKGRKRTNQSSLERAGETAAGDGNRAQEVVAAGKGDREAQTMSVSGKMS